MAGSSSIAWGTSPRTSCAKRLRSVHREGICDVGHRWLLRRSAGFQPRGASDVQCDPRGAAVCCLPWAAGTTASGCPLSGAAAQRLFFATESAKKPSPLGQISRQHVVAKGPYS